MPHPHPPSPASSTHHWLLTPLPGMGETDAIVYEKLGITNTAQLLQARATPAQQQLLAAQLKQPMAVFGSCRPPANHIK